VKPPTGMVKVTRDEFWSAVMAETRNIHPAPFRHHTEWNEVHPRVPWGWTNGGYMEQATEFYLSEPAP